MNVIRMDQQGTAHNSSQVEVTQMSINTEGQEPHRTALTASGSSERQEATDRSYRGPRAHTEDPGQGWSSTVGVDRMSTGRLCIERTCLSLDISPGPKAICCDKPWTPVLFLMNGGWGGTVPWNPPTSPLYIAMEPSQGDLIERGPGEISSIAQSSRTKRGGHSHPPQFPPLKHELDSVTLQP